MNYQEFAKSFKKDFLFEPATVERCLDLGNLCVQYIGYQDAIREPIIEKDMVAVETNREAERVYVDAYGKMCDELLEWLGRPIHYKSVEIIEYSITHNEETEDEFVEGFSYLVEKMHIPEFGLWVTPIGHNMVGSDGGVRFTKKENLVYDKETIVFYAPKEDADPDYKTGWFWLSYNGRKLKSLPFTKETLTEILEALDDM
jgi:hypothetical protein